MNTNWGGYMDQDELSFVRVLIYTILRALTVLATILSENENQDSNFTLIILHENDLHANFKQTSRRSAYCRPQSYAAGKCYGGFARVATIVKQERAAAEASGTALLYLDAGDMFTGSPWFNLFGWKVVADFVNKLKPDAMTLGNHDVMYNFFNLSSFLDNITTPVVASNLNLTNVPELVNNRNLHKFKIFTFSGVQVGVIGYLMRQPNIETIDEVVAVQDIVDYLKSKGVHIIIAIGHSGYDVDKKIAEKVDGIDLIIGGHTDTFLWNGIQPDIEEIDGPYPTFVEQASKKLVPVVTAYAYTKYIGKLNLIFNIHGELIDFHGNPILVNSSVARDVEVMELIKVYAIRANISQEIIGSTSVYLDNEYCRTKECNFGNLVTDAIVQYYSLQYRGANWTDAPIAIINAGILRQSIEIDSRPQNLVEEELMICIPYADRIEAVSINGTTFRNILNEAVIGYDGVTKWGKFLQFSGVRVVFNFKLPEGDIVSSVLVRCSDCEVPYYDNLEPSKIYKILMPSYLASGKEFYKVLKDLPRETHKWNEIDALMDYLKRNSPVIPEVDNRITLLNTDRLHNIISQY